MPAVLGCSFEVSDEDCSVTWVEVVGVVVATLACRRATAFGSASAVQRPNTPYAHIQMGALGMRMLWRDCLSFKYQRSSARKRTFNSNIEAQEV